eukprot:g972.t1
MHPLAQELGCKIRFNPTASKYGGSRNLPGFHVTLKHAAMCDMDQGYNMSAKDLYIDAPTYEFRSPTMIRKLLKNFDEINLWQMERMHSSYDARAPERQKCIEHPEPAWSGKKKSRGDKNGFPVLHLTDWLVPVAGGFYVARGEYDPDSLQCKEGLRPLEFFWTTLKSRLLEFAKRMLLQFNVKQFRVMEIVDQPIWISREEADAFQKEYINPFMPGNSYVSEVLKKLENKTIDCREQPAAMGPYTFGTIMINWAAHTTLEGEGNAAHRRSGLTEEALTNLFNVYPMTRFKYDSWYNWGSDVVAATTQAKMPKILETNITNVFLRPGKDGNMEKLGDASEKMREKQFHEVMLAYNTFNTSLAKLAEKIDKRNRNNQNMWFDAFNPRLLEYSVSL